MTTATLLAHMVVAYGLKLGHCCLKVILLGEILMPLINCPDCNKEVSDKAGACIHCGCPLNLNGQQQNNSESANSNLRQGVLVACHAKSGGGRIKDIETGAIMSFSPSQVAEKKSLVGYVDQTLYYEKVNGRLKVYAPSDAPSNQNIIHHSTPISKSKNYNERGTSNQTDSEKVTKNYLWYLMVLIIVAGYWISKGTPNPALFFTASNAKEECLLLANENKGSSFMFNSNEITANDTWLKDGKRVVQLLQKDDDRGMNQIMCVYGNGMVQIPSLIEQGRWR